MPFDVRPYQQEALDAIVEAELDQRGHLNRNLRFEYIRQSESRKINGLCSP